MNNFQIQVRGCLDGKNVESSRPAFVWKAPVTCRQFTVEMAKDSEFRDIVFLRDTHEQYYVYDGAVLEAAKTYYLRVRSGAGPWSSTCFTTAFSHKISGHTFYL